MTTTQAFATNINDYRAQIGTPTLSLLQITDICGYHTHNGVGLVRVETETYAAWIPATFITVTQTNR